MSHTTITVDLHGDDLPHILRALHGLRTEYRDAARREEAKAKRGERSAPNTITADPAANDPDIVAEAFRLRAGSITALENRLQNAYRDARNA